MSIDDGAVLLGAMLLIFSVIGLYMNVAGPLPLRNLSGEPAEIASGNPLPGVHLPFLTVEPSITPTSTPFQPQLPVPALVTQAETSTLAPAESGENSFLVPGTPQATPTPPPPPPEPLIPDRIVIPAIQLDARILPADYELVQIGGQVFQQWDAPYEYAAGWQPTSAMLGVPGNTVLNGHHNIYGSVFSGLVNLSEGDLIQVFSGSTIFDYQVTNHMILPERDQPLSVRMENARWLAPSVDERLTLITCWPQDSNTHRLIIVAKPVRRQILGQMQAP